MVHINISRLAGANALAAAIFALLFFEQGIEIPRAGSDFALLAVWTALFGYSSIIFTAVFLLTYKAFASLRTSRLAKAGLAWLAALILSLPGVSFMSVSIESFQGELDPVQTAAGAGAVAQFTHTWFVEAIDISPTAALFYLVASGGAYLFGGLQFGPGRLIRETAGDGDQTGQAGETIPNLKTRIVWALQADEHYVLVHGPRSAQQVLGRLKDAIAQVGEIAGMQVHRSWWVAREGIERVETGAKQISIILKNGTEVPVSQRRFKAFLAWHDSAAAPPPD
ncbi:response regulator receiver protein [Maricaulis maris MCS10]|uniref:Response regulator receiver protein n=1 Tax=Maricaulis maris (strain MCS10) TaxID=394221 RepID=Q0AN17_MARMM|nr:LytTR family DNA-binding domain-containing protein [Maricaulis maris]ABI66320.1 response regulator receiver protein [Maricaulis maris MCS10]